MKADFYKAIRLTLTHKLSREQVAGFEAILDGFASDPRWADVRHQAYALATIWHETATTMQPISEYGRGRGRRYGIADSTTKQVYYGRGYVQLTWADNYAKADEALGVNLYGNPDLALDPVIAFRVMTWGMFGGHFTGHSLYDHITGANCDYVGARKIINGTDRADKIARYAECFEIALKAKQWTT